MGTGKGGEEDGLTSFIGSPMRGGVGGRRGRQVRTHFAREALH